MSRRWTVPVACLPWLVACQGSAGLQTFRDTSTEDDDRSPRIELDHETLAFDTPLDGSTTETLTVSNAGDATLTLDEVAVDDPWVLEEAPSRIEPGEDGAVVVALTATEEGALEGELTLRSNDPRDPEVSVDLAATIEAPRMFLAEESLEIPLTAATESTTVAVGNLGGGPLLLHSVSVSGDLGFTLDADYDGATVAAGEVLDLSISVVPVADASATLLLGTNDPLSPSAWVELVVAPLGATLTSPADGSTWTLSEEHTISAQLAYYGDVETLDVALNSDLDGELWSGSPDALGLVEATPRLSEGLHQLSVTATDGELSADDVVTVEVACELADADGDGFNECDGDCDDGDPFASPDGLELCGNDVDEDCSGADLSCLTTFSGVVTEVAEADLEGWEICFSETYASSGASLATVLADCDGDYLMLACRPVGSTSFTVAAYAGRDEVTTEVGSVQVVATEGNGVSWYYSNSYSWGFYEQGDGVSRGSCDTLSGSYPGHRLCWHTSGGLITPGYRCGSTTDLNSSSSWERVILHGSE